MKHDTIGTKYVFDNQWNQLTDAIRSKHQNQNGGLKWIIQENQNLEDKTHFENWMKTTWHKPIKIIESWKKGIDGRKRRKNPKKPALNCHMCRMSIKCNTHFTYVNQIQVFSRQQKSDGIWPMCSHWIPWLQNVLFFSTKREKRIKIYWISSIKAKRERKKRKRGKRTESEKGKTFNAFTMYGWFLFDS